METAFEAGLHFVLHGYGPFFAGEGGFHSDPRDPGGATNLGVTQRVYDAHRRACGLPVQSVEQMSDQEMRHIYLNGYWSPEGCQNMPLPLAVVAFDAAVNSGENEERRLKNEVHPGTGLQMALELCDLREAFYRSIHSESEYLQGWLNRLKSLRSYLETLPASLPETV